MIFMMRTMISSIFQSAFQWRSKVTVAFSKFARLLPLLLRHRCRNAAKHNARKKYQSSFEIR